MKNTLLLMGFIIGLWACVEKEDVRQTKANQAEIEAYIAKKGLNTTRTNSGLFVAFNQKANTSRSYGEGDKLTFTFVETRIFDNVRFDSATVAKPATFTAGVPTILRHDGTEKFIVAGLLEGLGLMQPTDRATFLMPNDIAYGPTGFLPYVLPYFAMRFDVKLLSAQTEIEQIDAYLADAGIRPDSSLADGFRMKWSIRDEDLVKVIPEELYEVEYKGYTLDGVVFDSGTFNVRPTDKKAVGGFIKGVERLRIGERATIFFPSKLGYGGAGSKNNTTGKFLIRPYQPLIFELRVTQKLS